MTDLKASNAALQVTQQAVWVLAQIAGVLPSECKYPEDSEVVKQAKCILWSNNQNILWSKEKNNTLTPLRLLFDQVQLSDNQNKQHSHNQNKQHYWEATHIKGFYPQIPYPRKEKPAQEDIELLKGHIRRDLTLDKLNEQTWNNLSLLTLILEKFGSYVSLNNSDIALIDMVRATGAVAAALANNLEAKQLRLIAGDLSGIQKFIYTISSAGALKSLRARSFYLELVTEEVVQQLLQELELPRTNIIYAGGGNLYLLAPIDETEDKLKQVSQRLNKWLVDDFQGKVFLALDHVNFPIEDVATQEFATHWSKVTQQLAEQKSRKFADQIVEFFAPRDSHTPCKVCHRDDVEELQPLSDEISVEACPTCRKMFELGGKLLRVQAIVRSQHRSRIPGTTPIKLNLEPEPVYYHIFQAIKKSQLVQSLKQIPDTETIYLVNDWMIYDYSHATNTIPLLLGNYAQKSEEEEGSIIRSGEMARIAKGIERVGYLRMDVDRLGQIFAKGLGNNQTLPNLAGLSRQMSYFFKVYLNTLAENRQENFLEQRHKVKVLENTKYLTQDERKNLVFIYAGGDDVFVSGAWNEVVEFAFDVYQCFRAYTGNHPDITLSAGISIDDIKFPLYQAAESSGKAEDAAKGNGRDSFGLFGQVFKWNEWLGIEDINILDCEMKQYLHPEAKPNLLGVLPFVEILEQQKIEVNYSRNFVRNLLITAQIQEQALKKFEDRKSKEALGTRYYLHLPKIAYTLARLPNRVLDNNDFRTSLKSPYNAPYFRAIATWIELLNRL
ncbi:MAG: type III-A CRISPR-associated protein Cas10/Csm1 [Brasilonema angustatum HA4187-MV1]|jgi:CRISPR-associated protein Csm1|nr:type III-A CRISPR-associated protein Cas10/Csm1 [Brasilonema angustatum HA4187-MV1]